MQIDTAASLEGAFRDGERARAIPIERLAAMSNKVRCSVCVYMPYPGTPMTTAFRERGLIEDEDVNRYDGTTAVVRTRIVFDVTLDVPGANSIVANGINGAGLIVGIY